MPEATESCYQQLKTTTIFHFQYLKLKARIRISYLKTRIEQIFN